MLSIKVQASYIHVRKVWHKVAGVWLETPHIHQKAMGVWWPVHSTIYAFTFNYTIATSMSAFVLREAAILAGWDTTSPLIATVTIPAGVRLSAGSVAGYAFFSGVTFPAGSSLVLNNAGVVVGVGGTGGDGGEDAIGDNSGHGSGWDGSVGGTAICVTLPTRLNNTGTILAGGGGGGGGCAYASVAVGGGGGGGRGDEDSLGGWGVGGAATARAGAGTYTAAGLGASGDIAGAGGDGGSFGSSGWLGSLGQDGTGWYSVGVGGIGGKAVLGLEFISWQATGTILGALA